MSKGGKGSINFLIPGLFGELRGCEFELRREEVGGGGISHPSVFLHINYETAQYMWHKFDHNDYSFHQYPPPHSLTEDMIIMMMGSPPFGRI